jgi:hypothetical protein
VVLINKKKQIMENLIRVSTYAKQLNKSVQWIYTLEKTGKIAIVIIDGVKFVDLSKLK